MPEKPWKECWSILMANSPFRIGTGIDFHQLVSEKVRPLMLAGVEIPSEMAFLGHSDADVILHAVSDAILGAVGLGDIGMHFPNTDPSFRNISSSIILGKALSLAKEKGWEPVNVDVSLVGDHPKIAPIRSKLVSNLAKLMQVTEDCVSIKATTTEGMGSLGRGEGVMVMATALLVRVDSF